MKQSSSKKKETNIKKEKTKGDKKRQQEGRGGLWNGVESEITASASLSSDSGKKPPETALE